ncbi:MAG: peptide chain release factor 2 [Candidatus Doudnabacteria bacterium]|nr:peptide chain release factor 2 [Candidatus Doudnabacteria bacterium]
MNELIKRLESLKSEIANLKSHLNLPQKEQRVLELEEKMQDKDFWADNEHAQTVSREYNQLKKFYDFWQNLERQSGEILDLIKNNTDESETTKKYLADQVQQLESEYKKNRFVALLSKKYDDHNAIFSLHSGAGGVDAQDWASMLLRMFLRYCERRGFTTEILELSKGEQGGVKTAVVEVFGPYAYGLLKSEAGVHRLVRLSPFNPAHTRETSFALLELLPLLEQQEEFKVDEKDLKIEANTSSGHGGQSVNTTYSAIRITHIPTGLKVSIQNERSQHQNRELAMKILMAKLKTLEEQRLQAEKQEIRGEFKSAEWGNQIRSYVVHPYKLVKDHRTNFESTDPDSVLNGELDDFVEKYLEKFSSL